MPPEAPKPESVTHADLRNDLNLQSLTLQRIEKAMADGFRAMADDIDSLKKTVGYVGTDERGELIGEGIAGDLGRLKERVDKRFSRYDAWERAAAVAVATATIFIVAIWWLVQQKIEGLLR